MAKSNFNPTEIPYEQLEKFGLTREMVDDLPTMVFDAFLHGDMTPVALPISYKDENGENVDYKARIGLIRDMNGSVDLIMVPLKKERELEEFTQEQIRFLLAGDVITAELTNQGYCYVQFDEDTNQSIAVPMEVIHHNLDVLTKHLEGKVEMASTKFGLVQTGKVVEFELDDNSVVTVGIDLKTPKGLRMVSGTKETWMLEKNEGILPKYSFGIYGCWILDNDNLKYIPEPQYTKEIYSEMNRSATQHATSYRMGR